MHNTSGEVRVAAQNRWVPWWLSTNIGGGSTGYLSREELEALPAELQPLMRESQPLAALVAVDENYARVSS